MGPADTEVRGGRATDAPGPNSLRERKKEATRRSILLAARELFSERSFSAVTVSEIAATADVSERTFFRYFDTKEDLLLSNFEDTRLRFLAVLRSRPPGEAVLTSLMETFVQLAGDQPGAPLAPFIAELGSSSAAAVARQVARWERSISNVLAERAGEDGASPSLPTSLCGAVAVAAFTSTLREFQRLGTARQEPGSSHRQLGEMCRRSFALLAEACEAAASV
jgi:AcrR family transcriptional regulator